jgi:hypothetical protein
LQPKKANATTVSRQNAVVEKFFLYDVRLVKTKTFTFVRLKNAAKINK